jgi:hypothetical protein
VGISHVKNDFFPSKVKLIFEVSIPGGGWEFFFFTTASKTALGPTQIPIQWVAGALSLGVKRPGREADHLPPSSAEVKECIASTPQYAFMVWCSVKKTQ